MEKQVGKIGDYDMLSVCDYRIPHTCQFPESISNSLETEIDCGEPAAYYVWWDDEDDGWWVCKEHWESMMQDRMVAGDGADSESNKI